MRYFFHIGYNGFNYRGWQKLPQNHGFNVQFVIESQLSKVLKTDLTIVGCGRTDAQVHASQFFFHVDIQNAWDYDLLFRLNKTLPPDIAIFDIIPMEGLPHARFDAVERTYNYFIHTYKDPYLNQISALYSGKYPRVDEMKRAMALLTKYDDYRAFCKKVAVTRSTICKVTRANLYLNERGDNLRFEISANRFLTRMIRIIVYKILQIGRGELTVEEFESQLNLKEHSSIDRTAHPQGLYLSQVKYPFLQIPSRSELFNELVREGRWSVIQ